MAKTDLTLKYPPSEPCGCSICRNYCIRPGWWSVGQAKTVMNTKYIERMMVEVSPERDFGVLSPAFYGCEGKAALQEYSKNGCNFYSGGLCELHATGLLPLECAFCHHDRAGQGMNCHADLEKQWKHETGRQLVFKWLKLMGIDKKTLFI